MHARALYVAFDVFPRPKGSSSHIASMITALARDFAPVRVLCLGDADLPLHQIDGDTEIHRLPGTHRDVLRRAMLFAQFVEFHAARHAGSLELIVYRDPWGGIPAMRGAPGCPAIFEVNALPTWELAYSHPGFAESATLPAKLGDMERMCLRKAAAVLCVSAVTRRALGPKAWMGRELLSSPMRLVRPFYKPQSSPAPVPRSLKANGAATSAGCKPGRAWNFLSTHSR